MRINLPETQALVIDIQERLVPAMDRSVAMTTRTAHFLRGLGILGVPLTASEQYPKGLGATIPSIREALESACPGLPFLPKTSFSCFRDRDLRIRLATLADADRTTILVCGMETHVCVLQTVMDLKGAGFNPVVVADCVASRSAREKDIALDRFLQADITVSSAESTLFELLGDASHPSFKAVSALVKEAGPFQD